jgi:hypothetical protein
LHFKALAFLDPSAAPLLIMLQNKTKDPKSRKKIIVRNKKLEKLVEEALSTIY